MIQTTNNAKHFFEKEEADATFIYGAGNPGQWTAKFMKKCHMDFDGFIDRAAATDDCFILGKRIRNPSYLLSFKNRKVKLIIAIGNPKEAIADLALSCRDTYLFCMVPIYDGYDGQQRYDINKFLSYFRRKLLKARLPTILSNNCTAGFLYRALGEVAISPMVNTGVSPEDFLKICENPKEYFSENLVFDHWGILRGKRMPVGKIKDVEIVIAHSGNITTSIRNWNKLKEWIDYNNMIFILDDYWGYRPIEISYEIGKKFCRLNTKHLMVVRDNLYINCDWKGVIYVNHSGFINRDSAIENWFDLVGWINGEFR